MEMSQSEELSKDLSTNESSGQLFISKLITI